MTKPTQNQLKGIFYILLLILVCQTSYYLYHREPYHTDTLPIKTSAIERKIDSLFALKPKYEKKIYPFNPNYITDYKGYTLGMSTREIDRLHRYRASEKWINSIADFKRVTQVHDTLLEKISLYFKFPDWVNQRQKTQKKYQSTATIIQKDINKATADELKRIYGIGNKLSQRIIKYRNIMNGFVNISQIENVYGLSNEVISKIKERYKISEIATFTKINVNTATVSELSKHPYISKETALQIIAYRTKVDSITNLRELLKINKLKNIKLKILNHYFKI